MGVVHNWFYNRVGSTECYILPSIAFVRHDYTEMFRVGPGPEEGRELLDPTRPPRARGQPRDHRDRAGRAHLALDTAHGQVELVLGGERLEHPEQVPVGPSVVGQAVGQVQDPHGTIIGRDSPPWSRAPYDQPGPREVINSRIRPFGRRFP